MTFFILFITIPIIELIVFANVGNYIGWFTTFVLAFLTAILGGNIVRYQGLQTITAIHKAIQQGQMPLSELFDGFCLVAAGATLITPGFITDAIGFLLLIPFVRNILRSLIKNHTNWAVNSKEFNNDSSYNSHSIDIIEGECETLDKDKDDDYN
ncbi:MAG: FxsA family protein [Alphaproteobacteria bacterium]|nr:FxsA family protein [Alphaproteobacteria bacterium]